MRCDIDRFEKDFNEIRQFGLLENGGVTRLAFTNEGMQARKWLIGKMEEIGLNVSVGPFGNIKGTLEGEEDLPPVMVGSHIDTVPEGGHYDGIIGVLAGLEIARTIKERGKKTKRPFTVVNFSAEESSRFGMATSGSKVIQGNITVEKIKTLKDKDGISLYEALKECGYDPDNIEKAKIEKGGVHAFLELHIEQGPVLENKNIPIGIVTSIAAPTRFKVSVQGRADHSGNTPMNMRNDALAGAAEIITGVENITSKEAGENTVGTVGFLDVTPNAMNVIPGKVDLGIDIRDINMDDKNRAVEKIKSLIGEISERRNLKIDYDVLCDDRPVDMSDKIISEISSTAEENDIQCIKMPSGAGHDAMNMAKITDAGMIFIPSRDGISHNINEFSEMKDIETGMNLLMKTVLKLTSE